MSPTTRSTHAGQASGAGPAGRTPVDPARPDDLGRAHVRTSVEAIVTSNLWWMVWVWSLATLAYAVVLTAVGRYGEVEQSYWQWVVAGWQRWILLAAGVITVSSMFRALVTRGVTRARFGTAAVLAGAVLATTAGLLVTAGFAVERLVYQRAGWPQALRDDVLVGGWLDVARLGLVHGVVLAGYFVTGWLIGTAFHRWGSAVGTLLILPSAVPGLAVDALLLGGRGGIDVGSAWPALDRIPLVVGLAGAAAVLVGAVWVVRRLTHPMAVG